MSANPTASLSDQHGEIDMSWADVVPTPKDPKLLALKVFLAEFQGMSPNIFLRTTNIEGRRYFVVGTWTGTRRDKTCRINAAPGSCKSLVSALGTALVELDLRDEGADGEHRAWLLPHQVGLTLKLWLSVDGKNATDSRYVVLTEDGYRQIDAGEYTKLRGA